MYFLATFSKPFKNAEVSQNDELLIKTQSKVGPEVKGLAIFDISPGEVLEIQVALSHVSYEGAQLNWEAEGENINFDMAR